MTQRGRRAAVAVSVGPAAGRLYIADRSIWATGLGGRHPTLMTQAVAPVTQRACPIGQSGMSGRPYGGAMSSVSDLRPFIAQARPVLTPDVAADLQRLGTIYRFGVPDLSGTPQPVARHRPKRSQSQRQASPVWD